jgi:hypothetical protein
VVDVIQIVHEHARKTPPQSSSVGLPFAVVNAQREQARAGASHGTVTGPTPIKGR